MSTEKSTITHHNEFTKSLGLSVVAHLALLLFFVIQVTFFNDPIVDLSQAIRVDMVGLPNKIDQNQSAHTAEEKINKLPEKNIETQSEPEPVSAEKIKQPTAKVEHKKQTAPDAQSVDLKKSKSKQKAALEKLKKLSAIDKIKQEVRSEAEAKALKAFTQSLPKGPIKGRAISAGTALSGLDRLEANQYLQSLDQQIKQHWALPQWLMNKPFKAQVLIKLDANGGLISKSILKGSGQPSYDQYCLQAVEQAAPYSAVPEKLTEKFSVEGIVIGFPE